MPVLLFFSIGMTREPTYVATVKLDWLHILTRADFQLIKTHHSSGCQVFDNIVTFTSLKGKVFFNNCWYWRFRLNFYYRLKTLKLFKCLCTDSIAKKTYNMVLCSYFRTQISTRTNQLSIEIALMSIVFLFFQISKSVHILSLVIWTLN